MMETLRSLSIEKLMTIPVLERWRMFLLACHKVSAIPVVGDSTTYLMNLYVTDPDEFAVLRAKARLGVKP